VPNAYISGTGFYVPPRVVKNDDLNTQYGIDTNHEWIHKRTGIDERRYAEEGIGSADLGAKAAEKAIFDLGYEPAPTAKGYRRILEFARWIEARLRQEGLPELAPRDLIDIQSFIWFIAPTGRFAKE